MELYAGTSGYSYKEWKGPFYPEDLADAKLLAYYAERLRTVEINNTFYRMPRSNVMERWAAEVPDGFRFVIKAPQRITHRARLKDAQEPVGYLWSAIGHLGAHLGPVLFQLPPNFKKDTERLRDFVASLPAGLRPAFEFRHDSWLDDEVHGVLADAGAALCVADPQEGEPPALVSTADWGYVRLRRGEYAQQELARWAELLRAQPWREAWVFLKHEDAGAAPRMALELRALFEG